MTVDEINRLASLCADIPNDTTVSQKMLFCQLRAVYFMFKNKQISREQATDEKSTLIKEYENCQMWENIFKDDTKIHLAMAKLTAPLGQKIPNMTEQEAKDALMKMIALSDGRLRPEDV